MDQEVKERPVITMDAVASSQIYSIGYDSGTNTLAIRFRDRNDNGPSSLYHYANFTADDWEAFKGAESKGSHFGKFIKPEVVKYPYTKIA
jgi:hypothetical protein